MPDTLISLELLLRGGAVGTSLLFAVLLLTGGFNIRSRWLGALFSLSVAAYVLLSGQHSAMVPPVLIPLFVTIAIWGVVFFWWFVAALFDEAFRWHWWRLLPLALPVFYFLRTIGEDSVFARFGHYAGHVITAILFADAMRRAFASAAGDLVERRRYFRFVLASVVATFGLIIVAVELVERLRPLPDILGLAQAGSIFLLNILFGTWMLSPRADLFPDQDARGGTDMTARPERLSAADRHSYDRLTALMDGGVYREEGLTVAVLADRVGIPEHALRKLINQSLGFRNFSAFLNVHRMADAKAMLSDPRLARKHILQIALDLGYGSIAPFNRAFREAYGMAPSAFRKRQLQDGPVDPENM